MDTYSALTSGKTKVTTGGGSVTPIRLIEDGTAGIVIIGGVMSEGAAVVSLPENLSYWTEFTEKTLTGKKIGVRRTSTGDVVFRGYLRQQGVDISKIDFIELDTFPTIIEAVKKGEVDLGLVAQIHRKTAETRGLAVAKHLDELSPNFICCRIATTRKNIEAGRDQFVTLLKGNIKAYRILKTDPEKTLDVAARYYEIDKEILRTELYNYGHTRYSPAPAKNLVLDFYDKMTRIGYVKGGGPIAENVDISIFEEALEQVIAENPDPFFLEVKKEFEANK
jgi:NitT/TauT family transport system substrate-binding protein